MPSKRSIEKQVIEKKQALADLEAIPTSSPEKVEKLNE